LTCSASIIAVRIWSLRLVRLPGVVNFPRISCPDSRARVRVFARGARGPRPR
jgi:hypothetical protein